MSEGARLLREVADGIDTLAARVPSSLEAQDLPGGGHEIVGDGGWVADVDSPAVASWFTLWSPGVMRLFAEFLRDLAQDAETVVVDTRAVELAEVVKLKLEQ